MGTIEVTGKQIVEAAEKNGYEWGKSQYIVYSSDKIYACVLGQAALNLDVDPYYLGNALMARNDTSGRNLFSSITNYNDNYADTYEQVVKYVKRIFKGNYKTKFIIYQPLSLTVESPIDKVKYSIIK